MTITTTQKEWLGELFAQDIGLAMDNWRSIAKLPKRIGDQLKAKNLVIDCQFHIPGFPPVYVNGYCLTTYGHMVYCMSVTDEDLKAELE